MKKRSFIRLFALTLCLITIFSTVVLSKKNTNTKITDISVCKSDPHAGHIEIAE